MNQIKRSDLFRILCRSFFIQALWNYHSMLGPGFGFSLLPISKVLFKNQEEREKFNQRHLEFFNSHPYMATWCLGAVVKIEEENQRKNWQDPRSVIIFKERLIGPLGAIGDRIFWSGLKPLIAAISTVIALIAGWIALPFFLILYNYFHLLIRIKGLFLSYEKGFDIVSNISLRRFDNWLKWISFAGIAATAIFAGVGTFWALSKDYHTAATFIFSLAITPFLMKKQKPLYLIILLTIIFVIVTYYIR